MYALSFLAALSLVVVSVVAVCPDGFIALGQNENCNIFPGQSEPVCSGNFGAIYANDCSTIDIKSGAEDDDWCGGGYVSGA
ncbi:hypothetical protein EXIGLDRAFT_730651 [Exidia glandulosa HHB12029]|uniref:Kazal-like domain-containing protein n=1 Tax=Exidia glandulosa HHB12029 TaxID=1314781 RepID=A0A165L6R6_EXIGL|nr:hypothetical protein EXIGLDRAFT_730651 [Exidia glandulosa HHB12029]